VQLPDLVVEGAGAHEDLRNSRVQLRTLPSADPARFSARRTRQRGGEGVGNKGCQVSPQGSEIKTPANS
jgi:hypothetical protein